MPSAREAVSRMLEDEEVDAWVIDGLDEAIIGIGRQQTHPPLVVYDEGLIIARLVAGGLSEEEAWEHYEINIAGSWVGEKTPFIVRRA